MPIVDVEIVFKAGETFGESFTSELADRIGEALGAPRGRTWVKLRLIAREHYAEHGGTPADVFPVFASVLKSRAPGGEEAKREVATLTRALAQACSRSEDNVHVIYLPDAAGRVAFGGKLVE